MRFSESERWIWSVIFKKMDVRELATIVETKVGDELVEAELWQC